MASGRKPGPTGSYEDNRAGRPLDVLVMAGWGGAEPIGLDERTPGRGLARPIADERVDGLSFRLGSGQYRVRRAGPGAAPAPDEEVVPAAEAKKLLEKAAQLDVAEDVTAAEVAPALAGLLRAGLPVILLRVRPRPSTGGAPPAPEPAPAPPPKRAKPVKDGWIEIEVVDEAGEPRSGDRYRLELPDGRVFEGTVGSNGLISFHGIDPGTAKLSFPGLDQQAWS